MSTSRMERAGRRVKAGSLSGLSGNATSGAASVRRQRSLEWGGDRYSSSDDDRPPQPPPLADRVFASLLAQATQQFDDEQRRIYGSQGTGESPRYVSSPQRQSSPFPHESTNRRFYRRNRDSKGEELFNGDAAGGTLSRRRRADDFTLENNARNVRHCLNNGTVNNGGQTSERECESPPEPAPPEVPPRGPSLHVTLRHRPAPCDQPAEPERLYLSEDPAINNRHSSLTPLDVSATRAQPSSTVSAPAADELVASTSATAAVLPEPQLDDEILQLLGDAPKTDVDLGPAIHKDIADRWREILSKGLTKEIKEKLFKEHLIPANCELLIPPLLNPEVKAAIPDALIKRDNILVDRQKQIGIAVAALAEAMQILITKGEHSRVLKAVSDACRILCDTHFNETKTRRSFAISATNANLKDTLIEAKRDKYLFGDNMSDKLKSAKNIQKSGADLKQNQKNTKFNKSNFYKNKSLNTRALQRKTSGKPDAGRRRNVPTGVQTRATAVRTMTSSTRSRSPPPPPSRRPHRRT